MYGFGQIAMGPPVDPNTPVPEPDVQQQIADLWGSIFAAQSQQQAVPCDPGINPNCGGQGFTAWLNANAKTIALVAGVVGVSIVMGGRR